MIESEAMGGFFFFSMFSHVRKTTLIVKWRFLTDWTVCKSFRAWVWKWNQYVYRGRIKKNSESFSSRFIFTKRKNIVKSWGLFFRRGNKNVKDDWNNETFISRKCNYEVQTIIPENTCIRVNNFYLIDAPSVSAFFLYRISFSINGLIFCYYIRWMYVAHVHGIWCNKVRIYLYDTTVSQWPKVAKLGVTPYIDAIHVQLGYRSL